MVLVSLAIIFLPSLFHKDEPVVMNTNSEIPPAPDIQPVVIEKAEWPEGIKHPSPEDLFQPQEPAAPINSAEPEKPRFTEKGLPVNWVVQVGSFKSKQGAESLKQKLIKADLRAYSKSISTEQGEFIRVFVGPFISQKDALDVKAKVDKQYKLSSQVLRFNPAAGG